MTMATIEYPATQLYINGEWRAGQGNSQFDVRDPGTGEEIGRVCKADAQDIDEAASAAQIAFTAWKRTSAYERSAILRRAADLMRARIETIAPLLTMEQGKPLREARQEITNSADIIEWCAEEGRRSYGRVIPARHDQVYQFVAREPVGPVAAFTPWNFPIVQIVRKLAAALAAGCTIVIKGPEETPASPAALVRAFADAGVPRGVVNLIYGVPSEVSAQLISHPAIRKISFTGSTIVGKQLAAAAGLNMKRATMELGGHAPVIVFDDADLESAASLLVAGKFRNAGQVCASPTRFLVQESVYRKFVQRFCDLAAELHTGYGLEEKTTMGPVANSRRQRAVLDAVDNAQRHGARIELGGRPIDRRGNYFEPTVLTEVPRTASIMNEEPFGPVAVINPFGSFDDAIGEANRLPYGLAAFAFTSSTARATAVAKAIESGMISINHMGLALPEVPFGGVKDSGYGYEGGAEALEPYMISKFVTQVGA